MNIIIDGRVLQTYPLGRREGFRGGTETYVDRLASGLAGKGHTVHVVTPDLAVMEHRGLDLSPLGDYCTNEFWWPPDAFPTQADCVIAVHGLQMIEPYSADLLVLAPNGVDPWLGTDGGMASGVDAFACFSQSHIDLLCKVRPTVDKAKCWITGLGVDIGSYSEKSWERSVEADGHGYLTSTFSSEYVPKRQPKTFGRLLYANDPARGLWSLLDIFEHVKRQVPEARLHLTYDFARQFEHHRWGVNALTEMLWECKRRVESSDQVVSLGALSREDLVRQQLECQVHCMPSDPPNIGSQIHGITQMECAAAGAALVLSDIEAFPEVFGEAATILPVPGKYLPEAERRFDCQDWAEVVVELMKDEAKWQEASRKARALAEQHTWQAMVGRWDAMLTKLQQGVTAVQ